MWLAIDIGNTNVHFGVFEGDELQTVFFLQYEFPEDVHENFERVLAPFFSMKFQPVIISSVNPKIEKIVFEYMKSRFSTNPKIIGRDIPVPIPVLTENPQEVGADRLLNALAAYRRTGDWTIIIDAGTAITVDVVNDDGAFVGGIIAPGYEICSKALATYTALLPEITVKKPRTILGKNTKEAINSGVYWGIIGMVSKFIALICEDLKRKPKIIAAGGSAGILAQEINYIPLVLPNLTLEGIKLAYKLSK